MSRLDDLIAELCPHGVAYKRIGEVASVTSGNSAPQQKNYFVDGKYPFCRTADVGRAKRSVDFCDIADKLNDKGIRGLRLFPKGSILIPKSGASTLSNNRVRLSIDAYVVSHLAVVIPDANLVDSKYLYYAIEGFDMGTLVEDKSYPSVKSSTIAESVVIPIPPIEVQREIVRILDRFMELTTELTANLTAERSARIQQKQYYCRHLIESAPIISSGFLGEIAIIKTGKKPPAIIETPTEYEYINAGTTNSGFTSAANCCGNVITTPSRGQGGIGFVGYQTKPFWLGPLCYKIASKDEQTVANKYLFHYLKCFSEIILACKKEGGTPAVNIADLAKIKVDIPPLDDQMRIISILDQLDTLGDSLSSTFPNEIIARQKQYDYYREKLLTFRERA